MPYFRLFYHIIWTTKQRLPLITETNSKAIYGQIVTKTEQLGGILHAVDCMEDHVHLVVTIPPTKSLAMFVGQIKGVSSYVAANLPDADPAFAWQSEYGILSISESHLPYVVDYVKQQQKHHTLKTLDQRLEINTPTP
jgi:putative transposase